MSKADRGDLRMDAFVREMMQDLELEYAGEPGGTVFARTMGDSSVGIYSIEVSPAFNDEDELVNWLYDHSEAVSLFINSKDNAIPAHVQDFIETWFNEEVIKGD